MSDRLSTPGLWARESRYTPLPFARRLVARVGGHENRKFDRVLQSILPPGPGVVLELGCAPGNILRRVARLRPGLTLRGLDYVENGVQFTRTQLAAEGIAAEIECADLFSYTPAQPADVVLSCGLVEHFEDVAGVVRHHARMARPGGTVCITIPNFSPRLVAAGFRRLDPEAFHAHNLAIMNPPALRAALEAAGLRDVHAGAAGGPRFYVPSLAGARGLTGKLAFVFGKAWNVLVAPLPGSGVLWESYVWAVGTKD